MSDRYTRLRHYEAAEIVKYGTTKAQAAALEVLARIDDNAIPTVCPAENGGIGFGFCRNSVEIEIDDCGAVIVRLFHGAHKSDHLGQLVADALRGEHRGSTKIETTHGVRGTLDLADGLLVLNNGTTRRLDISRMHVGTPKEWAERPDKGPFDSQWMTLHLSDGETFIYRRIA